MEIMLMKLLWNYSPAVEICWKLEASNEKYLTKVGRNENPTSIPLPYSTWTVMLVNECVHRGSYGTTISDNGLDNVSFKKQTDSQTLYW